MPIIRPSLLFVKVYHLLFDLSNGVGADILSLAGAVILGGVDEVEVARLAVAVCASGGWPGRNGHPVTGRVKVGDVEDAGGAIGTPYALHKVQSGGDEEFACSTIPAKPGKKC
jgi:hypothetical protein